MVGVDLMGSMPAAAPFQPRSEPTIVLWDLVGSCNLKCPSCPMGSMRDVANANGRGFIADDLFHAVLAKVQRDFTCRQLHFYNWTEPLLHPRIVDYCRLAADAGFHVHLSTNLNHLRDAARLVNSGVKTLRVSLSGFTQEVYCIGHRGGDIGKVKDNMRRLSDARRDTGAGVRMHAYFHKYRHNAHEAPLMEAFARDLGFEFLADWAFLMPLEKLLAYADGALDENERNFADRSIVPPPGDALRLVQAHGGCRQPCDLIEQLVLDHRGRATLCCATFDAASNVIGDFLDLDWCEVQRRRFAHQVCDRCTAIGAHTLYTSVSHPPLRQAMADLAERSLQAAAARQTVISLPLAPPRHAALAESA
jgi:hypothetical protein